MKVISSPAIQLKIKRDDQVLSLNKALEQITDAKEHHFWCSGGLPFGQTVSEYPANDRPTFCWSAISPQGDIIGHMELHNNRFGWIIARVWVHNEYRRQGVAHVMYLNTLEFASSFTNTVGAFCYWLNEPSRSLLLELGFTCHDSPDEQKLKFFTVNPASVNRV